MAAPENGRQSCESRAERTARGGPPATMQMVPFFQTPTVVSIVPEPWPKQQCPQPAQQQSQSQQPQFVVFELYSQQQYREEGGQQQLVNLPKNCQGLFLPLRNSKNAQSAFEAVKMAQNLHQQRQQKDETSELRFTTVQLEVGKGQRSGSGGSGGNRQRLLFDDPMFRRLPNWHFFGDDRRLARIPALIPLLPVVERTLLYIAPSLSSTRQLMLLGNVPEMQRRRIPPGAYDSDDPEEDGALMLPTSSMTECPGTSSTSGVESMSSTEETTTTARSSRATSPMEGEEDDIGEGGGGYTTPELDDAEEEEEETDDEFLGRDGREETETAEEEPPATPPSSSASSAAESAPNSPSRRVVRRMSRGTRDAVRRLSRRFADEEDWEEERGGLFVGLNEKCIETKGKGITVINNFVLTFNLN